MSRVGAVVIGRNEGARLECCLGSLVGRVNPIVSVDSGSPDESIEFALGQGVEVVDLDTSVPFTAARARNAGFERLCMLQSDTRFVMFVDGDCKVDPHWWPVSIGFLEENSAYAVVCGRRRERFPEATVYNYLCDQEWNTPIGDAKSCGGDALMRTDGFAEVGGFNPRLVAGEEPDLCIRLRARGWKIRRIDVEMTIHDAAMTRFSQWWKRALRAGHAFAEGAAIHGAPPERHWVRETRRAVFWGAALPAVALLSAPLSRGISMSLLLLYPLNVVRVALKFRGRGVQRPWTVAVFMTMAKVPEALGWLRYQYGRLWGKRAGLIEYKSDP